MVAGKIFAAHPDKRDDQMHNALKGEAGGRVLDPAEHINGNSSRDG
jgi:hypothetical protein